MLSRYVLSVSYHSFALWTHLYRARSNRTSSLPRSSMYGCTAGSILFVPFKTMSRFRALLTHFNCTIYILSYSRTQHNTTTPHFVLHIYTLYIWCNVQPLLLTLRYAITSPSTLFNPLMPPQAQLMSFTLVHHYPSTGSWTPSQSCGVLYPKERLLDNKRTLTPKNLHPRINLHTHQADVVLTWCLRRHTHTSNFRRVK